MSIWSWSDPLGLGAFILGVALAFALFAWAVKTFASIPNPQSSRRGRR